MYNFDGIPVLSQDYRVPLPDPEECNDEGIIGFGGNLSQGVLLSAYEQGYFPWFSPGDPIIWWSPDPRFVLYLAELHISRRTLREWKTDSLILRCDSIFSSVIRRCAEIYRPGENGTWISEDMIKAYCSLHELGAAHSVEVFDGESRLVGGLYGVNRGGMFCGESMFSTEPGASKLALAGLVRWLLPRQGSHFIDSQIKNPHMERLGGREIPRQDYLEELSRSVARDDLHGWEDLCWSSGELAEWYRDFNLQRKA